MLFSTTMFCKISRNVKIAAMKLYEDAHMSKDNIIHCVGFSESTFWCTLKLWRETGDVVTPLCATHGCPRLLLYDDVDYLVRLIEHHPTWFLDEFSEMLDSNRFISIHYVTVHRTLECAGVSYKKLQCIAKERNELHRAEFVARMAQYQSEEIGFLDETSKDKCTPGRAWGRLKCGKCAESQQPFIRGSRVSALGPLTIDGMIASALIEGSFTTMKFIEFLELTVVSVFLLPTNETMDHTDLHKASSLPAIPWKTQCPHYGQHEDPSRRRSCGNDCIAWLVLFSIANINLTTFSRCMTRVSSGLLSRLEPY